ncbi:MAG: iron-sulfur cluster assembly scaffold protein [Acidobacteria bacterium]|nr:iron-sulfur cluster assembly scaffold protein [Acidobacteriota bacterium]
MFSAQVLDHFQKPRNAGELPEATAGVELTNPVCGDVLRLAVRVEDGRIAAVRFKCSGCVPAMAAGSLLTELMQSRRVEELAEITERRLVQELGGLPPASRHAVQLAADTLRALVKEIDPGG